MVTSQKDIKQMVSRALKQIASALKVADRILGKKKVIKKKKRKSRDRDFGRLTCKEKNLLDLAKKEPKEFVSSKSFGEEKFEDGLSTFFREIYFRPIPTFSFVIDIDDITEVDEKQAEARAFVVANEQLFFLAYNYCRMRFVQAMEGVNGQPIPAIIAKTVALWLERAIRIREFIANANMSLVISMVARRKSKHDGLAELVSSGSQSLLRAINKFDADRGFKFSTYACRAIIAQFNREAQRKAIAASRYKNIDFDLLPTDMSLRKRDEQHQRFLDELREVVASNEVMLTATEKEAVDWKFGFKGDGMTLAEVGEKILGVSPERVRQILNNAISKIKVALEKHHNLPVVKKI